MDETAATLNQITERIIHAAIEVHRILGPGLLESAYRDCLAYELRQAGCHVDVEQELPLVYRGFEVPRAFRMDLLVSGHHVGLLLNFNKETLLAGLKRVVDDFPEEAPSEAMPLV